MKATKYTIHVERNAETMSGDVVFEGTRVRLIDFAHFIGLGGSLEGFLHDFPSAKESITRRHEDELLPRAEDET